MKTFKVLVLGASGMLGNAIYLYLSNETEHQIYGSIRSLDQINFFPKDTIKNFVILGNISDFEKNNDLFDRIRPDIVINCIGVVKQLGEANNPLVALPINAMLPHQLVKLCEIYNARLVHLSTDCVFSGLQGMYKESDFPDARDLYGLTKLLGEVNYSNSITLRTSIIGHELNGNRSLLSWFLSQSDSVKGFSKAIFSGLPTTEIARVINDYIIPNHNLYGVFNISTNPINKYQLLEIFKDVYKKDTRIEVDDSLRIDRSLDSSKFEKATGYKSFDMKALVIQMRDLYLKWGFNV